MIRRLRIKFICIIMSIVTVMLLVIFGMVLHFTQDDLEKQSMDMLQSIMDGRLPPDWKNGPRRGIHLPWFRVIWNPEGESLVESNGYDSRLEESLQEILSAAREKTRQEGILWNYGLRYSKKPGPLAEQIVFVDISSEIATMQSLLRTCAFVGVLSFFAFLLLSILLARWAIWPLEAAWNHQRQFVADASHELKTPLAVIMTNAELLQDPNCDSETTRACTENILTMSRNMRALVENLLDLARMDGGGRLDFSELNLSELVSDCLLPFEPVYFERQLRLESEVTEEIGVKGSESHLKQVLDVLLDNGAKYTAPGGTVRVSLQRQGSGCLLRVAGPGTPISREDLKNIFKRFYRVDKARSRDGSYGLGLAIAERIVTEHGGRIWAESEDGINTFFVQLPVI